MSVKMGREKRGPLALELWAKQLIDNYPGVTIRNMTSSWRNGLAFCALIHRFRPDLIDYDKLDPSDIIGNCSLAFDTAESKLGIPALLDPEDMLTYEVPDRLSVLTYVAQFYSTFKNSEAKSRVLPRKDDNEEDSDSLKNRSSDKSKSPTPEKMIAKRKMDVDEDEIMDKVKRNMPNRSIMLSSSNVCSECKNPVFISERVLFMKKLYHRSCFKCSSCENSLNPHTADVSPDGLLFCLENKCHLELLRRIQAKQRGSHVSRVLDMQIKKQDEDSNSVVKLDEQSTENSENNLPLGEDKAIDINTKDSNQLSDNKYSVGRVNAMKALFNNVQGDGQNLGDIQKKPQSSTDTDRKQNKLMDFAGALLHIGETENNKKTDEPEQKCLTQEESPEPDEPPLVISDQNIDTANRNDNNTFETLENPEILEAKSDPVIDIRSTPEIISIRNEAVLNVADQFKHLSEETSREVETTKTDLENPSKEDELQKPDSEVVVPEIKINENPCSDASEEVSESSIAANSESISGKESIEESVIEEENALEKSTKNEDLLSNPFEDEDKPSAIPDEASEPPVAAPRSPFLKRKSPVPLPSSPVVSASLSPAPSPMPRTRSSKNKLPSAAVTELPTTEIWKREDYYPADLNPFESEEDVVSKDSKPVVKVDKSEPKNPFEDDGDEVPPSPKPRSSTPISKSSEINNNGALKGRSPANLSNNGANFNVPPPRPPPPMTSPRKVVSKTPAEPYNPFEDDDDDIGEYEDDKPSGVFARTVDDTSSISSKTSDMSSISGVPTPTPRSLNTSDTEGYGSTKLRSRKSKRAPLPPSMSQPQSDGTPKSSAAVVPSNSGGLFPPTPSSPISGPLKKLIPVSPKLLRSLKAPTTPQQYKKKRRAPPPRRRVEPLPETAIKTEFADLEVKQKELERQGITLESSIRQMQEEDESNENADGNHQEQLDEMIIQLWSIVNEKNDILRRQTELEYLRRGHRLEEMQSELEFKLRILMDTPADQKQPDHPDLEQLLLQQLLKLVDERNEVVEWLDYHRQLDREEDMMLSKSISQFSTSKAVEPIPETVSKSKSKSEKKAEAKAKSKEAKEASSKDKKKDGKLLKKLGIFGSKKNKKPKEGEEQNEA